MLILRWPSTAGGYAQVTRAQVLRARDGVRVGSPRAGRRVVADHGRYILPNIPSPILVQATFAAGVVLVEAGLSFSASGRRSYTWGAAVAGDDLLLASATLAFPSPALRSACWCWAATCSAMVCATTSTRRAAASSGASTVLERPRHAGKLGKAAHADSAPRQDQPGTAFPP